MLLGTMQSGIIEGGLDVVKVVVGEQSQVDILCNLSLSSRWIFISHPAGQEEIKYFISRLMVFAQYKLLYKLRM